LGERTDQRGLFEADHMYLDHAVRRSFQGFLASMRGRLFRDQQFADLYCPDSGRSSVLPSLLAAAIRLQAHDKVSDDEARQRALGRSHWEKPEGRTPMEWGRRLSPTSQKEPRETLAGFTGLLG
jgi:hypothetical protein